jgi:hypothetical protein
MKRQLLFAAMLPGLGALPVYAAKDCNELKMEIAAKIEANGVKNYDLSVRHLVWKHEEDLINSQFPSKSDENWELNIDQIPFVFPNKVPDTYFRDDRRRLRP